VPAQETAVSRMQVAPLAAGLVALLLLFLAAYSDSIAWIAAEWSGSADALGHGYLVIALSAVLFARAIPDVARIERQPAWWLVPVVLALSLVWLLGSIATVVLVQTVALPAILFFGIAAAIGTRAARPLAFPILFVYFALPGWVHFQPLFQSITVAVVGGMIRLTGLPALMDGNLVHLGGGTFEIARGCSGLAFVVSATSLAVLYSYLYYDRLRPAIQLLVAALLAAMLGNWIRVYAVIHIGHHTQMQSSLVDDHLTFGWIIFAVLMIPVFLLARALEPGVAADRVAANSPASQAGRRSIPAFFVVAAALIAGPAWAAAVHRAGDAAGAVDLTLPPATGRWTGPSDSSWQWSPRFAGPDAEVMAQYGGREDFVLVYANLYRSQTQDRELIYFDNRIEGDWRPSAGTDLAALAESDDGLRFNQLSARNPAGDWLIWYRFQVGNTFEASAVGAKITQATETLRGRPASGVVAFATRCSDTCREAATRLDAFVTDVGHRIRVTRDRQETP